MRLSLVFSVLLAALSQSGAANADETWTVYYWGSKNRGNFVKLLFELKGVAYATVDDFDTFSKYFAAWDDGVFERNDDNVNSYHSPMFAVPAVRYVDPAGGSQPVFLSQTAAVVSFVASKLDIGPEPNSLQDYQARKIVLDCFDISAEIYALSKGGDYRGYTMEEMRKYIEERFEKWMNVIEFALYRSDAYLFGNKESDITYADLAIFNVMDGLFQLFGEHLFAVIMNEKHPKLANLYASILKIENINAFISAQNEANVGWFNQENIVNPIQASLFPQYGINQIKSDL